MKIFKVLQQIELVFENWIVTADWLDTYFEIGVTFSQTEILAVELTSNAVQFQRKATRFILAGDVLIARLVF